MFTYFVWKLGGVFKYFSFSPLPGEMIQLDKHVFSNGWFNHQLGNCMGILDLYIYISSITLSSELPQPKYFVMPSVWKGTIIHICLPQHGIPKKETVTIPPPCNWIRLMIETRQNKVCQEFVIVFWVFRMFATMVIIIHPPHVGEMGMSWYNTWQMVGSCLWVSWMTRSFQRFVNKQYIHKSSNLLWPSKNSKTLLQMFF